MRCPYPKYLPKQEIEVPCNNCGICLQNKKSDWTFRLRVEQDHSYSCNFITLTYDEENVPKNEKGQNILQKKDLQDFFKRLRYYSPHDKIRYYATGEYGGETKRPHFHVILFNAQLSNILKAWPQGHVDNEKPTPARMGYTVGYLSSIDDDSIRRGVPKQFSVMSRGKGLGYQYVAKFKQWHKDGLKNYTKKNGIYGRLPRYLKEKIFNKEQIFAIREKAKKVWEAIEHNWYYYFKKLNYPDPYETIREMERNFERMLYERQKLIKLHI